MSNIYYVVDGKIVDTLAELDQHINNTSSSVHKIEAESHEQAEILATGIIKTSNPHYYDLEVDLLDNKEGISINDQSDEIVVALDQVDRLILALTVLKKGA